MREKKKSTKEYKIEKEGIMVKSESFSFHSSILHAVHLFLKLHRHEYVNKEAWPQEGRVCISRKHLFKWLLCVFAQLKLACLATSHSLTMYLAKTFFNWNESEQSLPLLQTREMGLRCSVCSLPKSAMVHGLELCFCRTQSAATHYYSPSCCSD